MPQGVVRSSPVFRLRDGDRCVGIVAGVAWPYAQSPAEFYKGKNIELDIGYSVGGAYDLYARVLARHLGQHIPGQSHHCP